MSVEFNYFFNSSVNLPDLAAEINGWLGSSLAPYQGNLESYFARFLALEFSLHEAKGYENDRDMDFENYNYTLDFRTAMPDFMLRPMQLPAMLAVIKTLYLRMQLTGMLVYDLQILLAKYEERRIGRYESVLYDLVSGTPFDVFENHLLQLRKRLPEEWIGFHER